MSGNEWDSKNLIDDFDVGDLIIWGSPEGAVRETWVGFVCKKFISASGAVMIHIKWEDGTIGTRDAGDGNRNPGWKIRRVRRKS